MYPVICEGSPMLNGPKIAILGIHLESNRFAPSVCRPDFEEKCLVYGEDLLTDSRGAHPRACGTLSGFVREMDKICDWTPAPLVYLPRQPSDHEGH